VPETDRHKYTLGLDLGSSSLGWALIELDANDNPLRLMNAGVRIFDPGVVGGETEIERGRDKSKASERRLARQRRKQTYRKSLRQKQLFRLLQQHGLLPSAENGQSESFSAQRHEILNVLDKQLTIAWRGKATVPGCALDLADQSLVYLLRRDAVESQLSPFEIGRILYHLAQRRGYFSNGLEEDDETNSENTAASESIEAEKKSRKMKVAKEKTLGEVAAGISSLRADMEAKGTRYIGSYFALVNPHEKRIRHRWTERAMFVEEFTAIWNKQKEFYPELLTDELEAKIRYWLFFQRPLASANHLVGFCELQKGERRAPWATLEAQRFRLLQRVNDLRVIERGMSNERPLRREERERILDHLEAKGDLTFKTLKELLGSSGILGFNLERGTKDRIEGNRVNVHMLRVFGDRWNTLSAEDKHKAVEQWRTVKPEKLEQIAKEQWQLNEFAAKRWGDTKLARPPKDYCNLSRLALSKVLPLMEGGCPFKTVEREIYGKRFSGAKPSDFVPKVMDYLPSITNPAVMRALTELRKVVNAIVREYGKPYQIRIELARELRKNRRDRERQFFDNKARQEKREKGARWILAQQNRPNPTAQDIRDVPAYMIEKWLLAEECHWICPYTKKAINYANLFTYPEFEVEHIIPLSRCTDNSFANKTLCHRSENQKKSGKTPWEAYQYDDERWAQILKGVSQFANGPRIGDHPKLRRFKLRLLEEIEGFTRRQLTDTRYTSKLAARLLMALYGGRDTDASADDDTAEFFDKSGRRIFASTGGITKLLRDAWLLHPNVVLELPSINDGEKRKGKDRSDHRHHAVDALVIGLTTESQVREVSLHAQSKMGNKWPLDYRDLVRGLKTPWSDRERFLGDVFHQMLVSHKPEQKLAGSLHIDTIYPQPKRDPSDGKYYVSLRRSVAGITDKTIEEIQGHNIREAVRNKLLEYGGNSKKFNPDDLSTLPVLKAKDGRLIPIKKVHVREAKMPETLTQFPGNRYVESESIHHFELFVRRDARNREEWTHVPVSIIEAHARHGRKEPVISRIHPEDRDAEFLFSLAKGDMVELEYKGERNVFKVKKFYSDGRIWFTHVNNAQKDEELKRDKTTWGVSPNPFRLLNPQKVTIDPLGRKYRIKRAI
jgi:CRISPR-associated endonuclease Csn1